jgi:2-oxoglutarate ferredoxin oxidoreductase subunit alpha
MQLVSTVNDVVIKIATVNGTGSASANGLLMKAIFRMGIPVVGKNYFPSNIQGLPTWYEIRVTGDGCQARTDRIDMMVAGKTLTCWACRYRNCATSTLILRGHEF